MPTTLGPDAPTASGDAARILADAIETGRRARDLARQARDRLRLLECPAVVVRLPTV